ncbi:hypothetical protein [Cohnella fermenti]|uniref:Uncharacterized protein n=1 Tax=Cohnella fermenti TaxID=2565925 RepID=A0A4S4C1B2_9BACL|nr:hypothetical protein [Cohnella fermenti]THF81278.1 hypothetical protein E6C55_09210 [Cohnella fermenti]
MDFDVSFSGWATALIIPIAAPFISSLITYIKMSREEKLLLHQNIQIFLKLLAGIGKFLLITGIALFIGSFEKQDRSRIEHFPYVSELPVPSWVLYTSLWVAVLLFGCALGIRWVNKAKLWFATTMNIGDKQVNCRVVKIIVLFIFFYAYILSPIIIAGYTLNVLLFYWSAAFELDVKSTIETVGYLFSDVPAFESVFLVICYFILYLAVRVIYAQLFYISSLFTSTKITADIKLITNEVFLNMAILKTSIDGSSLLVKDFDDETDNKIILPKSSILYIKFNLKQTQDLASDENPEETAETDEILESMERAEEVAATTESPLRILLPPDYK